eukprot:764299-Pelagomonas_calceolata.AAC.2
MAAKDINELAKRELADAASYLFFEWDGSSANVLAHSFKVCGSIASARGSKPVWLPALQNGSDGPKLNELPAIAKSVDNRDEAIKHGLTLQGTRYEVHKECLKAELSCTGHSMQAKILHPREGRTCLRI